MEASLSALSASGSLLLARLAMWSKKSQRGQVKVELAEGEREERGAGSVAAWELVQYLGALEQFVT